MIPSFIIELRKLLNRYHPIIINLRVRIYKNYIINLINFTKRTPFESEKWSNKFVERANVWSYTQQASTLQHVNMKTITPSNNLAMMPQFACLPLYVREREILLITCGVMVGSSSSKQIDGLTQPEVDKGNCYFLTRKCW